MTFVLAVAALLLIQVVGGTTATVRAEETPIWGVDSSRDSVYTIDRTTGDITVLGRLDPTGNSASSLAPNRFVTPVGLTYDTETDTILVWNNSACEGDFGESCNGPNQVTTGDLVEVDPDTGAGTPIGSPTGQTLGDIAFDPVTGQLYGITGSLWLIDRNTAALTEVGPIQLSDGTRFGLSGAAFSPDGTLYGLQAANTFSDPTRTAMVVTIDTTTGNATVVGEITHPGLSGGITFLNDGTLVGSAQAIGMLFDIDAADASVSNPRGSLLAQGLASPVSQVEPPLWGIDTATDALYMLDRTTGDRTLLGRLDPTGHPQTFLAPNRFTTPTGLTYDTDTGTILAWNNSKCTGDYGEQCTLDNSSTSGDLLMIDPVSGEGTTIGNETGQQLSDIAYDPISGQLFGVNASLWTIDRDTAEISEIGRIRIDGSAGFSASGAAFAPDGTLYAMQLVGSLHDPTLTAKVVTIDTATAAATVVGEILNPGLSGGIAFLDDGSLVGSAYSVGMLFDIDPTDGTISNQRGDGTQMAQALTSPVTPRPRSTNYALEFDGFDDVARMTDVTGDLDFDFSFTVEATVFPYSVDTEGAFRGIVRGSSSSTFPPSGGSWVLFQDSANGSKYGLSVCVPSCGAARSGAAGLTVGEWHHLAGTYDGSFIRTYLNGVQVGASPHSGDVTNVTWAIIGLWSKAFHGVIDDVRLWNVTRTEAELLATMNSPLTGSEPGLVGWWSLNEGSGQIFADESGTGNPGLLGLVDGPDERDPRWVLVDDVTLPDPGPDTGSITIVNETTPSGGTGFGYTSDVPGHEVFTLDDGQSEVIDPVLPGTYTITIDDMSPLYEVAQLSCSGDPDLIIGPRYVQVTIVPDRHVECSFTSALQGGSVTITNLTEPSGGTGFDFTSDLPGAAEFTIDDGGSLVISDVPVGPYEITMGDPSPSYLLTSIVCAGDRNAATNIPARQVTLRVDPGEDIICTFTSELQAGSITIANFTIPRGGTGFNYTSDIPGYESFTLDHRQTLVVDPLAAGTYAITIGDHSPTYRLEAITCAGDPDTVVSYPLRTATIDLDPGEDVTCAFTSTRLTGSIHITNAVSPSGAVSFGFASDIPGGGAFALGDGESASFIDVPHGDYTVTMDDQAPVFALESITCTGDSQVVIDLASRSAVIDLDAGEDVACEFSSTELPTVGNIRVSLFTDPPGEGPFAFNTELPGGSFVLPHAGSIDFTDLDPREYAVSIADYRPLHKVSDVLCEGDPGVDIDVATGKVVVDLDAAEDVVCKFYVTRQTGNITIISDVSPDDAAALDFITEIPGNLVFSLSDGESRLMLDRMTGSYSVSLADNGGWFRPDSIDCTGDPGAVIDVRGGTVTIDLDAREDVVCEFSSSAAPPTQATAYYEPFTELDGEIASLEWPGGNAPRVDLENGHVIFAHDENRLHVLLNLQEDRTSDPGEDWFEITVDVDGDGVVTPGLDRIYKLFPEDGNMRSGLFQLPGTSPLFSSNTRSARAGSFDCFYADGSFDFGPTASTSDDTCDRHRVWEIGIDFEEIGIQTQDQEAEHTVLLGIRVVSEPDFDEHFPWPVRSNFTSMIEVALESTANYTVHDTGGNLVLEPRSLEVTQAIQTSDNALPLAAGKTTFARSYVTLDDPDGVRSARVFIHGETSDGQVLPGSPLVKRVDLRGLGLRFEDGLNPGLTGDTVNFKLPDSWIHTDADFQVIVRDFAGDQVGGSAVPTSFVDTIVPTIWVVPLETLKSRDSELPPQNMIDENLEYLENTYPVKSVDWVMKPLGTVAARQYSGYRFADAYESSNFFEHLGQRIGDLNEYYDAVRMAWMAGLIANGEAPFKMPDQIIGFVGIRDHDGELRGGGLSNPVWGSGRGYVNVVAVRGKTSVAAHEFNHNLDTDASGTFGRHLGNEECLNDWSGPWDEPTDESLEFWRDRGCEPASEWQEAPEGSGDWYIYIYDADLGCGASGPDSMWPTPPIDDHIRNTGARVEFGGLETVPSTHPDFMSYCTRKIGDTDQLQDPANWISPYRWLRLMEVFTPEAPTSTVGPLGPLNADLLGAIADGYQDGEFDSMHVSGSITADGKGNLDAITVQPGGAEPPIVSGDYFIQLFGPGGELLDVISFPVSFVNVEDVEVDEVTFNFTLPLIAGITEIRLVHRSKVLDKIKVSNTAPVVEVVSPNGGEYWSGLETISWTATDPDSGELTFTILYTPDDGVTWVPVVSGLTETSIEIDSSMLTGGDAARVRIIATDGFNTSSDESDDTFKVADSPPHVSITSHSDSEAIPFDTGVITFSGYAYDNEDGALGGASLTWKIDGVVVGIGDEIQILPALGVHTVELLATDSTGSTSAASIGIVVADAPVISLAAAPDAGQPPLEVVFTATANDNDITEFRWDFESDGIVDLVSTDPVASHQYVQQGTYWATVEVFDSLGLSASASAGVVASCTGPDTMAPLITGSVDPAELWSPNHSYAVITIDVEAVDNCSESVSIEASVLSSEPDRASGKNGRGDRPGDILVTTAAGDVLASSNDSPIVEFDPTTDTLELRVERLGDGTGRIYWITITATDGAGNASQMVFFVAVPHDSS